MEHKVISVLAFIIEGATDYNLYVFCFNEHKYIFEPCKEVKSIDKQLKLIFFCFKIFGSFYLVRVVLYQLIIALCKAGNTNWGRRLSTMELLIKVACFAQYLNFQYKKELVWDN